MCIFVTHKRHIGLQHMCWYNIPSSCHLLLRRLAMSPCRLPVFQLHETYLSVSIAADHQSVSHCPSTPSSCFLSLKFPFREFEPLEPLQTTFKLFTGG